MKHLTKDELLNLFKENSEWVDTSTHGGNMVARETMMMSFDNFIEALKKLT